MDAVRSLCGHRRGRQDGGSAQCRPHPREGRIRGRGPPAPGTPDPSEHGGRGQGPPRRLRRGAVRREGALRQGPRRHVPRDGRVCSEDPRVGGALQGALQGHRGREGGARQRAPRRVQERLPGREGRGAALPPAARGLRGGVGRDRQAFARDRIGDEPPGPADHGAVDPGQRSGRGGGPLPRGRSRGGAARSPGLVARAERRRQGRHLEKRCRVHLAERRCRDFDRARAEGRRSAAIDPALPRGRAGRA
mmetsp:Transcript_29667/g.86073  ORF Transcript_29667/g.86073 Transcript_29667/m.86073 type:complete len:249 (-) Transcript_29667:418-1164(-)